MPNQVAINLIKQFESCELVAYRDLGGVWTIGWGSTGLDIKDGVVWTQDQADFRLALDVVKAEVAVCNVLNKKLSDGALAALDSFVYNLGSGAFASSHLLQCINSGDYVGATKAFLVWDHVAQIEVKGLLVRRLKEATLFLESV